MPTLTWYLRDAVDAGGWQGLDTATQAAVTTAAGWVVGTGSTNSSELQANNERASSTFVGNTVPDGSLDTSLKDAFRSPVPLYGSFASANWAWQFAMRATVNGGTQSGAIVFRLIKADADGGNATEVTAGQQTAGTASSITSSADVNSSSTFNPGAFSVVGQYLFIQIAWKRTVAGGMTTSNVRFRTGSAATPTGTVITTSTFTPAIVDPDFSPVGRGIGEGMGRGMRLVNGLWRPARELWTPCRPLIVVPAVVAA